MATLLCTATEKEGLELLQDTFSVLDSVCGHSEKGIRFTAVED